VALVPDAIAAFGGPISRVLQQTTRTIPIVFVGPADPVGSGMVATLARPGSNATGFAGAGYGMSAKWLELLKGIAPGIKRVAVIRDPSTVGGGAQLGAILAVASTFGVDVTPIDVRDGDEIARSVAAFTVTDNSGMIVTGSTLANVKRDLITALAD